VKGLLAAAAAEPERRRWRGAIQEVERRDEESRRG
jgi:hypothetical protein